jgi:hypothetical protein
VVSVLEMVWIGGLPPSPPSMPLPSAWTRWFRALCSGDRRSLG